jgi:hypothetical protein
VPPLVRAPRRAELALHRRGTLTVDDLATEEFPYVTFDGRFKGLWP